MIRSEMQGMTLQNIVRWLFILGAILFIQMLSYEVTCDANDSKRAKDECDSVNKFHIIHLKGRLFSAAQCDEQKSPEYFRSEHTQCSCWMY